MKMVCFCEKVHFRFIYEGHLLELFNYLNIKKLKTEN